MKTISIKEAVRRATEGESLKDYTVDLGTVARVNVSDALLLNEAGIVVPEEKLYYDDENIQYDEELDELELGPEITGMSWEEKAALFANESGGTDRRIEISTGRPEVDAWVAANRNKLERVLAPIVIGLYEAERGGEPPSVL